MCMKALKKLRLALGYNQVDMASILGRSKQDYRRLETTARKLDLGDIKLLRKLARDADWSDRELLDELEAEGNKIKKTYRVQQS